MGRRGLAALLGPLAQAVRRYPFTAVLGVLPGVVVGLFASGLDAWPLQALVGVLAVVTFLAGLMVALVVRIALHALRAIPDNDYGLCSGWAPRSQDSPPPLTTWLHEKLGDYSGRHENPLTFGDLWAGPTRDSPPVDPTDRFVRLEMMTTNLTNRRADRLPWDTCVWYFDPAEMRRFFPEDVVKWMEDNPAREPGGAAKRRRTRLDRALLRPLRPMPDPENLPVIVATRMSLSFPVLLSAVPLWRVDMARESNQQALGAWRGWAGEQDPTWDPLDVPREEWPDDQPTCLPAAEPCWFSDGGASSNFPVHFFDATIPSWPTFAINLRPFAPYFEKCDEERDNTRMVEDNIDGQLDWWYPFPSRGSRLNPLDRRLGAFLSSIIRTMQNRVDEAQMRMPGYRDRVAHVHMTDDEGGMNLNMEKGVIDSLTERGRAAAERLVEAYTRPAGAAPISWDNHRWVRLRSTLSVLEQMQERFGRGYDDSSSDVTYDDLLHRGPSDPPASYRLSVQQKSLAAKQVAAIQALREETATSGTSLGAKARDPPRTCVSCPPTDRREPRLGSLLLLPRSRAACLRQLAHLHDPVAGRECSSKPRPRF